MSSDPIQKMLNKNRKLLKKAKRNLSKDQKRYLEYFWNSQTEEWREVPLTVISFFEAESSDSSLNAVIKAQVRVDMLELENKEFVKSVTGEDGTVYGLTTLGVDYIKDQHPRPIIVMERLWERTPKLLGLIAAIVGFVAAVIKIVQGLRWLLRALGY